MLVKWTSPMNNLSRPDLSAGELLRDLDGFLRGSLLDDVAGLAGWVRPSVFAPSADILETSDQLMVVMDLPGHDPKSLDVKVEGDLLTVTSERPWTPREGVAVLRSERGHGTFCRTFVLPATVDGGRCEARFNAGVLTLTLPKRDEARRRSVAVKVDAT